VICCVRITVEVSCADTLRSWGSACLVEEGGSAETWGLHDKAVGACGGRAVSFMVGLCWVVLSVVVSGAALANGTVIGTPGDRPASEARVRAVASDEQAPATKPAVKQTESAVGAIHIDCRPLLPKGQYVDVFEAQLNLILNEYWRENGDWKADMMNDATAFAPRLLFEIYARTGNEVLYDRAIATCRYQMRLTRDVLAGKGHFDVNSVSGVNCLLASARYAKGEHERAASRDLLQSFLNVLGGALLFDVVPPSMPNLDECKSIGMPLVAATALGLYQVHNETSLLVMARKLIAKHEREFLDHETGLFGGKHFGSWNSAMGLAAYAEAYTVTRDSSYLQKANALIKSLRRLHGTFAGVFFHDVSLDKKPNWGANLSTAMIYIEALWTLYESTGDEAYSSAAGRGIEFVVEEFTLSRAYPEGIHDQWFGNRKRVVPFFAHDIMVKDHEKRVSPSYCLGCNFNMLDRIWDYNNDVGAAGRN